MRQGGWRRERGRKGWRDHERVSDSETDEKTEAWSEGMISRPRDHLVALHSPKPRSLRPVPVQSQFSCTPVGAAWVPHWKGSAMYQGKRAPGASYASCGLGQIPSPLWALGSSSAKENNNSALSASQGGPNSNKK